MALWLKRQLPNFLALGSLFAGGPLLAQDSWQPHRIDSNAAVRHISDSGVQDTFHSHHTQNATTEIAFAAPPAANDRPLVWERPNQLVAPAPIEERAPATQQAWRQQDQSAAYQTSAVRTASAMQPASARSGQAFVDQQAFQSRQRQSVSGAAGRGNPLRGIHEAQAGSQNAQASAVRLAAYQQQLGSDPFGYSSPPSLDAGPPPLNHVVPESPLTFGGTPTSLQDGEVPQSASDAPAEGGLGGFPEFPDPLGQAEPAPPPGAADADDSIRAEQVDPEDYQSDELRTNPFRDGYDFDAEAIPVPEDTRERSPFSQKTELLTCNEVRDRIRARPLSSISLDVSPSFGVGRDSEIGRLELAASSREREWTDNKGMPITTGRMIDLRDDRVILDVDGHEESIALHNLSDYDIGYVGDRWNIPFRCGTGNEPFNGRSFVGTTMQWTAPGHCHKPLYFEQTQLERYGHEAGPVVQPLLSTAHFFANIAVLPYKMGIHPPNECQYSLGYIRPGNCAPYMVQPIPLSLRGAAAQASVVTGAAALIP